MTTRKARPAAAQIADGVERITDNQRRASVTEGARRVGFSLTIPEDLLEEAREYGRIHHRSVASLLIEGLEMKLGGRY